ncbi:MAG: hypothetical protein HKN28_05285 [Alphaproteobacteria bacterium]|nr:hypothetical protein [Alphaproteobacteria bacterium]
MNPAGTQRILIALAPEAPSETIFEPVFKIALRGRTPVECICIEDSRLLDVAALPQSRIIHTHSHEPSPLDEPMVRRAMRVASGRARERFEATITRTSISWTFRTRQAALLSEAFSDAAAGDLIVVPLLRGARNQAQLRGLIDAVTGQIAASLLVLNETGAPDRSVLAVFDGDRADLAAARDLAVDFGCPLTVFAVDDDTKSAQDRAQEVEAFLDEFRQEASVRTIVLREVEDLNQAILDAAPGTLVLDRLGKTVKNVDIVSLLAQSSGSLLLRN